MFGPAASHSGRPDTFSDHALRFPADHASDQVRFAKGVSGPADIRIQFARVRCCLLFVCSVRPILANISLGLICIYIYIYIYSLPGPAPTVRRPCLPSTGPVLKPPAPLSNTYQSAACVREEKRLEQLATPSVESGFAAEEPKGQSASIRRILKAIIPEPLNGNRGPFHVLQHALDVDVLQYLRSAPYFRCVVCSSWTLPTENGTKQEHLYHTVHGDKVPGSNRLQKTAFGSGQVCL